MLANTRGRWGERSLQNVLVQAGLVAGDIILALDGARADRVVDARVLLQRRRGEEEEYQLLRHVAHRQLAEDRQGDQGEEGVDGAPEASAIDQGQRSHPPRVGQGQAQGDRTAHGVSDQVERPNSEGVEEAGHEGGQVAAWGVATDRRGAVSVTGQAQGQHPMCPGEGRDNPPPTGRALLVAVQQQQRRPSPGLQVLGAHPIHGDPTEATGMGEQPAGRERQRGCSGRLKGPWLSRCMEWVLALHDGDGVTPGSLAF